MDPAATIYMGKDKVENEDLIKYGDEDDVWFHVDKVKDSYTRVWLEFLLHVVLQLSSAHVYLRLPSDTTWETIPIPLLDDLSQLVKANSIEGNKKDNQQIIYTPWSNIKKTGDMAIGTVTFYNERKVHDCFRSSLPFFLRNKILLLSHLL